MKRVKGRKPAPVREENNDDDDDNDDGNGDYDV
jgi:hypothetical protein